MLERLKDWFFDLPLRLNARLRWSDLRRHRIEKTWLHDRGFIEGYSTLAFWLPLPLIVFFAYGLPRWRGLWLFVASLVAIATHLVICRYSRGRRLPQFQWVLLAIVAVASWWLGLGAEGSQVLNLPYAHLFGLFGTVVLLFGMPASRKWADWLIGRDHDWFRAEFATRLADTQLFVGQPKAREALEDDSKQVEKRGVRLLRSYALVPFSSLLMLAIAPALVVVVADPGWELWSGIAAAVGGVQGSKQLTSSCSCTPHGLDRRRRSLACFAPES